MPTARATSPDEAGLRFAILGPLVVTQDGEEVRIATRRQRALLVLLIQNVGRVVPSDRLIDQLWDGSPPPQGAVTLRSYVSNLRTALGGRGMAGSVLVTRGQGYLLDVAEETVDVLLHQRLVESARGHLRAGQPERALEEFAAALALWRGDPLAEIADHETAQAFITELTETHLGAMEGMFEAQLATGRHVDALPRLEAFTRQHPLRERPRSLLMLALYRAGRTADALEVHRRFRELLADELGIDPSLDLDRLHQSILNRDPDLEPPAVGAPIVESEAASAEPATSPPQPRPATPPSPSTQFTNLAIVGRQREVAVLSEHLERLQSGTGALLLFAGEPGIGKTTLLEAVEAEARSRGIMVVSGRSIASTGAPAFWPWSQVLDAVAADLDDEQLARACVGAALPVIQLSERVAERVGKSPAMTGDSAQAMRFLLYEAVSAFLRQAVRAPILIALDDLQWADRESLELLSFLTPTLASRRMLIVAAYRDVAAETSPALEDTLATVSREDAVEEMKLLGLGHDAVSALATQIAHRSLVPPEGEELGAFIEILMERTGGNPFFVRQLGRLLMEGSTDTAAATSIPSGIRHVIASRLRALDRTTLDILEAAAVIGREFDPARLVPLIDLPADVILDGCDEATRHGLLEVAPAEGSGFRFVHALVQEVLRESLPRGRAARLHAAAGRQLIENGLALDQAAEHLWQARDVVGAEALQPQLLAAQAAAGVYAFDTAERYLRRALVLAQRATPSDPRSELRVLLLLFRLIASDRGWGDDDARRIVHRAIALSQPDELADDTTRLWWSVFFSLMDLDDTEGYAKIARSLGRTLSHLEGLDPSTDSPRTHGVAVASGPGHGTRAAVHIMGIFERLAMKDEDGAARELSRAREHVDLADAGELADYDEHLHVMLLLIEAHWAALAGDLDAHRSAAAAAVALADADGRAFPRAMARALSIAGLVYVENPLEEGAVARVEEALELANKFGFTWLARTVTASQYWVDALSGRDPEAAANAISEFVSDLRAANRQGNLSVGLSQLADVFICIGRKDDARAALEGAIERPGPYQDLIRRNAERRLGQLTG